MDRHEIIEMLCWVDGWIKAGSPNTARGAILKLREALESEAAAETAPAPRNPFTEGAAPISDEAADAISHRFGKEMIDRKLAESIRFDDPISFWPSPSLKGHVGPVAFFSAPGGVIEIRPLLFPVK